MLRHRVGEDDFFRGLRRYGVVFAYRTTETSDLRKVFERLYGISLERFFYDWTERKGHPKLSVNSTYDPDDHLVRINVQQTQKDEPFHFVFEVELTGAGPDGKPIVRRQSITEKEQTLLVPVEQRPKLLRIDPEFTLLADIEEVKAFDWWRAQLNAPSVAERIRAIEHLADSNDKNHRELLTKILQDDPFYGVRVEAAKVLGKQMTDVSETALIDGLNQPHPKVRRACAEALAKFTDHDRVKKALLEKEKAGDQSYYVTAAVLKSLATVSEEPDIDRLLSALDKDSHKDVIRSAALSGLGQCKDPRAFETLVAWTNRGHSRNCRRTAIGTLGDALSKNNLSDDQKELALSMLEQLLADSGPRIRSSAMQALGKVPNLTKSYRTKIETLAKQDAHESNRVAADKLLKQMDSAASETQSVGELRSELDQLKQQNSELQKRLERLEKK